MLISNVILLIAIELVMCVMRTSSMSSAENASQPTCSHQTSTEIFVAAYQSAMIVVNDPDIIYKKWSSSNATKILYSTDMRIFSEMGFCNPEAGVMAAASAVGLVDPFTLPVYFKNAAFCVAGFLVEEDRLDCGNAIDMAIDFHTHTQKVLDDLDATLLESYIEAVVRGIGYILRELGFSNEALEENWDHLADLFLSEYKENEKGDIKPKSQCDRKSEL